MPQPIVRHSVQDATSAVTGSAVDQLGHYHAALFAAADDTANLSSLTVQMEVSPDGDHWSVVETGPGTPIELTASDLDADATSGTDTACVKTPAVYARSVRANVADYSGSTNVNAWVMLGGYSGQGRRPTSRKGAVSENL